MCREARGYGKLNCLDNEPVTGVLESLRRWQGECSSAVGKLGQECPRLVHSEKHANADVLKCVSQEPELHAVRSASANQLDHRSVETTEFVAHTFDRSLEANVRPLQSEVSIAGRWGSVNRWPSS